MERYDSYKDSGVEWIGKIPSHWIKSKLKFVSEIVTGNTPPTKDEDNYEGGEHLWVKPNEINGLIPTNNTNQKLTEKGKSLSRVLPPFSVFVNGIGRIGEFGYSEKSVSTNQQINSIIFNQKVDKRFGLFHTSMMKEGFLSNSEKVVVPILNKTKQENIDFVLPSLPEQHQIVSFLDTKTSLIDSLIEKTLRKIELLKNQRISLVNEIVTKGLNPNVEMKDSGVEWIGEIPSHWEISRLKYVSEVLPSNVDKHIYPEEIQVKLCNYTDVYYNEKIDCSIEFKKGSCNEMEYEKFSLKIGDVIITKDSESPDDIGIPCLIEEELTNVVCGYHLTLIRSNPIVGGYVFRFIQSDRTRKYFEVNSNGITRYGLGKSSIQNLNVPLPPVEEQKEIIEYLDNETQLIDKTISNEEKRIELLKEYRQSLISEVVTGKIKVSEV